jgi:hypothetical protein
MDVTAQANRHIHMMHGDYNQKYPTPAHSDAPNRGIPSMTSPTEGHQLHQNLSKGADHTTLIQQLQKVDHGWNVLSKQNPTLAEQVVPTAPQNHGALTSQWEPPFIFPQAKRLTHA